MKTKEFKEQVASLMRRILYAAPHDFVGLGLIFYNHLHELSHVPLQVPCSDSRMANVIGDKAVADVLAELSSKNSPWHDGFHFIRLDDFRLTHIAQFVSPKIPAGECTIPREQGARHMAAALASLLDGIALAAVLPADGNVMLYEEGKRVLAQESN